MKIEPTFERLRGMTFKYSTSFTFHFIITWKLVTSDDGVIFNWVRSWTSDTDSDSDCRFLLLKNPTSTHYSFNTFQLLFLSKPPTSDSPIPNCYRASLPIIMLPNWKKIFWFKMKILNKSVNENIWINRSGNVASNDINRKNAS